MRKKLIRNITALTMAVVLAFSATGCGKASITANTISQDTTTEADTDDSTETTTEEDTTEEATTKPSSTVDRDSKEAKKEQDKFKEYTEETFRDEISSNILNLHCCIAHPENYGIDDYDISLGNYTEESDKESYKDIENHLKKLKEFDYELLTDEQQLTYDIFKTYLEDTQKWEDFRLYSNPIDPLNGVQSYLPTILAEYAFYDEQDIKDYLAILDLFPDYFKDLVAYLNEQSEAGFFIPDFEVEQVLEQCDTFTKDPDNHYMIASFNERIDAVTFLDDTKKGDYKNQNIDKVKNSVLQAYRYFKDEISKLKGTGKNDKGLYYYENGTDYYELLVREYTGSDRSVTEIKKLVSDTMKADFNRLQEIIIFNPDAVKELSICDNYDADPTKTLNTLIKEIQKDFPEPKSTSFEVNYVPASMEEYSAPAYYLIPALDTADHNLIYINKSKDALSDERSKYTTLAHEGFPGHLYQTTYYYSTNPSLIRKIFALKGYLEGWGQYAENIAYNYSGNSEIGNELALLNNRYTMGLYCMCDIGIHYEGWDLDQTKKFVKDSGFDASAGEEIFKTLIEMPSVYLAYHVGYLEFMSLQELAKDTLGDKFSMKEFHKFLLETGPAQFELIKERMLGWMATQSNSSGSGNTNNPTGDDGDDSVLWLEDRHTPKKAS